VAISDLRIVEIAFRHRRTRNDIHKLRLDRAVGTKGNTMSDISRRSLLGQAACVALAAVSSNVAFGDKRNSFQRKIPVLHATDLFRPHVDPDDHWDLACIYALAHLGDIDLKAVVIDFPPKGKDPDIAAIAQLNHITGLTVPAVVGSPLPMKSRDNTQPCAGPSPPRADNAANMVLDVLRSSPQAVIINITGCCRDIAIAGKKAPQLFQKKCAAIYLNAGAGSSKNDPGANLEYNVSLDRAAYAAIFDLPCPVYWMPCFEQMADPWKVRQFGTFYRFRQDQILPYLSDRLQNYFAYMLGKVQSSNWLAYLTGPKDAQLLAEHAANYRNMWCTGGFLHAAGETVSRSGEIFPLDSEGESPVFTFDPIKVRCSDDGATEWTMDQNRNSRHIFHVQDIENYGSAMTAAMKSLLMSLPQQPITP